MYLAWLCKSPAEAAANVSMPAASSEVESRMVRWNFKWGTDNFIDIFRQMIS